MEEGVERRPAVNGDCEEVRLGEDFPEVYKIAQVLRPAYAASGEWRA